MTQTADLPPGTIVTATGNRFANGISTEIRLGNLQAAAAVPDQNGNFEIQFQVPALSEGLQQVDARNEYNVQQRDFLVSNDCPIIGTARELVGTVEVLRANGT